MLRSICPIICISPYDGHAKKTNNASNGSSEYEHTSNYEQYWYHYYKTACWHGDGMIIENSNLYNKIIIVITFWKRELKSFWKISFGKISFRNQTNAHNIWLHERMYRLKNSTDNRNTQPDVHNRNAWLMCKLYFAMSHHTLSLFVYFVRPIVTQFFVCICFIFVSV